MAVTALVLAGILGIQTPQVQTYLSQRLLENMMSRIDADIHFEKLHFKPFNTVVLKNVSVTDDTPVNDRAADTLFRSEYIIARFSLKGLRKQEGLHIWRAYIKDAEMNLVIEEDGTNLQRVFGLKKNPEKKPSDKNIFDIRRVDINGMRFRLQNFRKPQAAHVTAGTIDWSDLDVRDIRIAARNLRFSHGVMSGRLDWMSFNEKSGYVCNSLSGKAEVGNGKAILTEIEIQDPWSEVSLPSFTMTYSGSSDFKEFIDKVRLDAEISPSSLDMGSLGFFAASLKGHRMKSGIQGAVHGFISGLGFDGLSIDGGPDNIAGVFSGTISGLPDVKRMFIDLGVSNLRFSTAGLENFISEWGGGKSPRLRKYAEGTVFDINGRLRGTLDRLDTEITAGSGIGSLMTDIRLSNLMSGKESIGIEGLIRTEDLDIGKIIGSGFIRECSLEAGLEASLGNRNGLPSVSLDSLMISRLNVNRYDYSNIAAKGTIAKESFDGKIICNDPNLNFMFQGLFNLSRKTSNALYKFYLNVGYADLHAMNIDKRGISRASFRTSANFRWIKKSGDILGNIDAGDIVLENSMGKHDIGDISITSYSGDDLTRMRFSSGFAEASYIGSGSLMEFARDFSAVTLRKELPSIFRDTLNTWSGGRYRLAFRSHDSMDLLAFLAPGMYIADSTSMMMEIDRSGTFEASIQSSRVAFKEQYIKDMECSFDNRNGSIGGEMKSGSIKFATLMLKNNSIELFADNDHIGIGFSYDNESTLTNRGEFFATGDVVRDSLGTLNLGVSLLPSSIYLNAREWSILPSRFSIRGKEIDVENIGFTSGDQAIRISGKTSEKDPSDLTIDLDRFDISIVNPLLRKNLGISGALTGEASLTTPYRQLGIKADFLCDSTRLAGSNLGTVVMSGTLDNVSQTVGFRLGNMLAGKRTFSVDGTYRLGANDIDVSSVLEGFDISCAAPFVDKIFSGMDGNVSGLVSISGPLDRLSVRSENAVLDNAGVRIAYTNVLYRLNGGFRMDDEGIHFDRIMIEDDDNGRGVINGGISYSHFRDVRFDTRINVLDMKCIDLPENTDGPFYGTVDASGTIELTGPVRALFMNINAVTSGDGEFHVPLSSSANAGNSNLLTFKMPEVVEETDPYEQMIARLKEHETSEGDFRIRMQLAAGQGVQAFIEIDKASGNVISGRGDGTIDLEVEPSKDLFNITGDYTIASGNYRFVALGIASRDFSIQEGSAVRFNGDIMESTLDINATYNTKASLSTLIADTTSVANRRAVECGISITDKISNPRLAFSINIPDLDPTVLSRVESALSTEDKVQKQFLSLILSNSFLPDEQSGIVNNASMLYSNVSELMSNQLNNIFQKLNIPLDLGLRYQPNDKGNDIFDVAVSTQLFNNRVIVNGNIGNRQYDTGNSNSDVVGDLDIEIKLTRSGALRLNLFSHSADEYTNYLDNSQRNGIGIAYQKEFDRIDTFFKNMFTGRKKREAAERRAFMERRNQKKKVIRISPDTGSDTAKTSYAE